MNLGMITQLSGTDLNSSHYSWIFVCLCFFPQSSGYNNWNGFELGQSTLITINNFHSQPQPLNLIIPIN